MNEEEVRALFKKYSKIRVTLIKRTQTERKQVKKILRANGLADVDEYGEFDEAWEKLQLRSTNVLAFSLATFDGVDFLDKVIESARFKQTPLIVFTDKMNEHKMKYSGMNLLAEWDEAPINGFKVEQALIRILENGIVEKSQVGTESVALQHYTQAVAAYDEEEYEKAKELLRQALKENPNFVEAYLKMVETLIALEDYATAKRVLTKMFSLSPEDTRGLVFSAEVSVETEVKEKALALCGSLVEKHKQNTSFIIDIGNVVLDKGWVEEAIGFFEIAKNADPNLLHVYNRLGIAHSRAKRFDDALEMYEKAMSMDEQDAGIHFNIAVTLCRQGKKEKALGSFKKAAELDPSLEEPRKWIEKIESEL